MPPSSPPPSSPPPSSPSSSSPSSSSPSLRDTTPDAPAPVRAVSSAIASYVDRLGAVWVEGQVAQFSRRQGMATVFMTLRDPVADLSIQVTCPRTVFDSMDPPLVEGARIIVWAKPSVYPARGSLSLAAREIRLVGIGELLARLERRRQLLAAEGLFSGQLKRSLPFLPRKVGLVTSPGSDAERDVIDNARRRWPAVEIVVAPARMQGHQSALEVIEAAERLDRDPDVDVIVIARGGGSIEDLLPFSDEALIRAVHQLRTPVVSAIGHEADQPLLDLVADVRASTPTDAARRVVPDLTEERARLDQAVTRLRGVMLGRIDREQSGLDALRDRPAMADPRHLLNTRLDEVTALRDRARRTLHHRLDRATDEISHQRARATAMSPLATLERGYAVLLNGDGHVVTSVGELRAGDALDVRVADGHVHGTVTTTTAAPDPTHPESDPTGSNGADDE